MERGGGGSASTSGAGGAGAQQQIQAKVVLLGDMGAGKSSIALRFSKDQFNEYQESTIGAAFVTQTLPASSSPAHPAVKFEIWDTAGQERYRSLAPMYYRHAAAAIVVFDITSEPSFEQAKTWVNQLFDNGSEGTIVTLCGNKKDRSDEREVSEEAARAYAEEQGLLFMEVSAKSGEGVHELFKQLATKVPRSGTPATPQRQPGTINVAGSGAASTGASRRASTAASQCCPA